MARRIAKERVELLFSLAETAAMGGKLELSRRYIELMLKIARKHNIRLGRDKKRMFCKSCHTFLLPGRTAKVRLKKGRVIIKCEVCGTYKRYPLD